MVGVSIRRAELYRSGDVADGRLRVVGAKMRHAPVVVGHDIVRLHLDHPCHVPLGLLILALVGVGVASTEVGADVVRVQPNDLGHLSDDRVKVFVGFGVGNQLLEIHGSAFRFA